MIKNIISFLEVRFRILLVLAFILALIIHLFPNFLYADLAAHFLPYYALSLFIALPVFLLAQNKLSLALWAITFTLYTYPIGVYLPTASLFPEAPSTTSPKTTLKVFMSNVYTSNTSYNEFKKTLLTHDPKIAILLEISSEWTAALKELEPRYRYIRYYPRSDNFGIGILSKYELLSENEIPETSTELPYIDATVRIGLEKLKIYGIHPVPPAGQESLAARNALLKYVTQKVAAEDHLTIVAGDFNTTMWTRSYRELISKARLVDPREGRGFYPTWPTTTPFPLIPIDHILTSSDFKTLEFRTVPIEGSDHLAVLSELALMPYADPSAP